MTRSTRSQRIRKTLPKRSAVSRPLAWYSNPRARSPRRIEHEPRLLYALMISVGEFASSASASACSRSSSPPGSPRNARVVPIMFSAYARSSRNSRASAIRSASCATGIASRSARTMWKRAKLANTNAFGRDGGAPSTSSAACRWRASARSCSPRVCARPARIDSASAARSRSPAASKWASADSSASAPPCSARQYSAFPCRKSRSARSSSSEASSTARP